MEAKHESCVSSLIIIVFAIFTKLSFIFIASFVKPCNLNDPMVTNCIISAMEALRPRLPAGIPEMHIPRMEPLLIESAVLESGNDLIVNFKNMNLYGLTTFKPISGNFDIKNNFVKMDLHFDKLWAEGEYKIKGKLLFLNLNGAGQINGTISKFKLSNLFSLYFFCFS